MSNVNTARMTEQEEHDLEYKKFKEHLFSHIKVGEPLSFRDDDPFLIKKLEDAIRVLEEAPLPDWLVKRMNEKE